MSLYARRDNLTVTLLRSKLHSLVFRNIKRKAVLDIISYVYTLLLRRSNKFYV